MTTDTSQKVKSILMPDIGEGVVEGEVTAWLKNPGDTLLQDEPVVEVMTDKATVELPTPYAGVLAKQYYKVGEIAIKGKPLYDVAVSGEIPLEEPKEQISTPQPVPKAAVLAEAVPAPQPRTLSHKALATPVIRKLAKDLGVDVNQVHGTGSGGRVTGEDLRTYLTQGSGPLAVKPAPTTRFEDDIVQPLVGIRRLVAKKMAESKRTIPHFGFYDQADATLLVKFREKNREQAEREGIHLTFVSLFVRALSLTVRKYPQINASVDEAVQAIVLHQPHNIGIAMKTPQGLIVPVLKGVQDMSLHQIIRAYHALRQKALTGGLKPEDMRDSTITLSNFGTEGGLWAAPVINYPEAAILATAKIRKEPVVRGNSIVIRDMLNCSWSFDHRIIDGDLAAACSKYFIHLLENPSELL